MRRGFRQAGEQIAALQPDVLVVYSTQWISVLGHSFQTNPNPKGLHVADMGFKAFAWLMGVLGTPSTPGNVLCGPVWRSGAAVVEYTL